MTARSPEAAAAHEFGRGWRIGVWCGVVLGVAFMLLVWRMGA